MDGGAVEHGRQAVGFFHKQTPFSASKDAFKVFYFLCLVRISADKS